MLVLSRKKGEKILMPGLDIEIEVVEIRGNKVRLGITAPDDVNILRGELTSQPSDADAPKDDPNQSEGE